MFVSLELDFFIIPVATVHVIRSAESLCFTSNVQVTRLASTVHFGKVWVCRRTSSSSVSSPASSVTCKSEELWEVSTWVYIVQCSIEDRTQESIMSLGKL